MLNDVVQQEPATSLDPELMGPVAAIGIVKGKPFAPDARMKKIITEALEVANATSRSLFMNPREADWYYYPASSWQNYLFVNGYEFETPIPEITREGVKPFPPTGYRTLNARTNFFYGITGAPAPLQLRWSHHQVHAFAGRTNRPRTVGILLRLLFCVFVAPSHPLKRFVTDKLSADGLEVCDLSG